MGVELAELVKVEVAKTSIANISPSAPCCEGIGKALVPVDDSHNTGKDVVLPLSKTTLRIFYIGRVVARRVGVESTVNAHVRYSRSVRVKDSPVPTCSPSYSRHAHRRILLFFELR